jgi:glutamine synthetase
MHDCTYFRELSVSNAENGYRDILAKIDLSSFRRIPWEQDVTTGIGCPFFLVSFYDPETEEPIAPCPRNLLATVVGRLEKFSCRAMAGAEYEFYNFLETPSSLGRKKGQDLEHITPGMFGYSVTRPAHNQMFYSGVFDACRPAAAALLRERRLTVRRQEIRCRHRRLAHRVWSGSVRSCARVR